MKRNDEKLDRIDAENENEGGEAFFMKRRTKMEDLNIQEKLDDMVLESLSSDEDLPSKIKPTTLNQKDRIILVPLKPSENVKLTEDQVKMIKD